MMPDRLRQGAPVWFEEWSRKGLAAGAILAAHALVLYALAAWAPALKTVVAGTVLNVQFIAQPEAPPQWQPPKVNVVVPVTQVRMPDLPPIEIAVAQEPSNRAITIPVQPPPAQPRTDDPSVPKLVSAVEYVREPAPRYPPQSRRLGEQGMVVLRVVIDERGNACSIEVESSSGFVRLDAAAREAVARAAFRPYVEDGAPRRAQVLIPIEFSLNRGTA
jgi:protein TonB